jgi:hypothetical protein
MSGPGFIAVEPDGVCEACGIVAETRPYGKNGENICHSCGQKDIKTTERKMREYLFGEVDQ